ncbi:hypothetical protein [Rhodococcus phage P19]|nr:hypothetical protein [Rhodococcus phage P19]
MVANGVDQKMIAGMTNLIQLARQESAAWWNEYVDAKKDSVYQQYAHSEWTEWCNTLEILTAAREHYIATGEILKPE